MKNILALSIVLYGEKYISKFFNISFKTIIQNLNDLNKEFRIKFIISTDEKSIKEIESNTNFLQNIPNIYYKKKRNK